MQVRRIGCTVRRVLTLEGHMPEESARPCSDRDTNTLAFYHLLGHRRQDVSPNPPVPAREDLGVHLIYKVQFGPAGRDILVGLADICLDDGDVALVRSTYHGGIFLSTTSLVLVIWPDSIVFDQC